MKAFVFLFSIMLTVHSYARHIDFDMINFNKADSMAGLYSKHSLKDLKNLADKLTKSLPTQEEKFRAIYRWICNNIEYDYELFLKNKQKKEKLTRSDEVSAWNKRFSSRVFQNLRDKHQTICSGYAYLLKELAYHAGLFCVIIDGYARTSQANIRGSGSANHSWNAIQLYDKWYLCDVTWSSGAYDTEMMTYIKSFDASYFLTDPSLFILNHYPLDSAWMLLPAKPTLKQFLNGPLIYKCAFQYNINPLFPKTFDVTVVQGKSISFQFRKRGDAMIKSLALSIQGPGLEKSIEPKFYSDSSQMLNIDHTFTHKGTYVVHVILNNSVALTYTVKVMGISKTSL